MHTRICPTCDSTLTYKTNQLLRAAEKRASSCKSCALLNAYATGRVPDKSGTNNPMFGISLTERILSKWGDEGQDKVAEWKKKQSAKMAGVHNISFGKIRENSGRSYKGWYKGLFFRSSYELAFIIGFEETVGHLPHSAENRIKIAIEPGKTYTPDFMCEDTNTIYEIKASRFLADNQHKFNAAMDYCVGRSLSYVIVTEKDLSHLPPESGVLKWLGQLVDAGDVVLTDKTVEKVNARKNPA